MKTFVYADVNFYGINAICLDKGFDCELKYQDETPDAGQLHPHKEVADVPRPF